ncbi:putative uncharacterized protein [Waddlia chondrophila 2032/99]|uniref:Uncharacterized protein n=2 Tax=Waddlia chondrophila TaxID=71667 RepID=D6YWP1_WADCW|nr:hypothetical protein [Waddlia chondrophila]ADI38552.1 conserved hypothetical protein [Waddlia chondrophila WSU 86-1044]CCB91743.1 putative uncharacterized protein [Waddlia chondrophila 2032/99]
MNRHKVRLSVDCTEDERMYIKMLAAKEKKTISEFLISLARNRMPQGKIPNKETQKILRETEEGKNLESHESLRDFWKSMGIDPNAED